MKRNIIYFIIILFTLSFISCDNDDVDKKNSVFDEEDLELQSEFDRWLYDNYVSPYNITLDYKFNFMENDFNYNLTPAKFELASGFSQIIKYCWLEAYDEVVGIEFTRNTCPKEICLIGSKAEDYSGTSGTSTLGTATGGTRVTLYEINEIQAYTYETVIGYMHVMHHEFSHILDQKKKMDPLYGQISMSNYLGDLWTEYEDIYPSGDFYKLGFVSAYSTSDEDEDYAEVYSRYLITTDEEWEEILRLATVYDANGKVVDSYGRDTILQKLKMIKEYLKEQWNIDMDELKKSVQRRAEKASSLEILKFNEFAE